MSPCDQADEREEWIDGDIVCPWVEIEAKVNHRLRKNCLKPLTEQESFQFFLVILKLYEEGVKPTFAEIHFKLKEGHVSDELLETFLVYYFIQSDWYQVLIGDCVVTPGLETNVRKLVAALDKNREEKRGRRRDKKQYQRALGSSLADAVVLFQNTPIWWEGWVDLQDTTNRFSPDVWMEFFDFLHRAGGEIDTNNGGSCFFKNTRYALAKALKYSGPPTLRDMRLGDIAHLIQIAIQNGLLCYESTTILPSWTSYTMASLKSFKIRKGWSSLGELEEQKLEEELMTILRINSDGEAGCPVELLSSVKRERCESAEVMSLADLSTSDGFSLSAATSGESFNTSASRSTGDLPISPSGPDQIRSIEHLREVLIGILEDSKRVLLSQLRVLLLSSYNVNLKPSQFGFVKLSDLLMEHASDLCVLIRHRSRHVYVESLLHSQRSERELSSQKQFIQTAALKSNPRLNLYQESEKFLNAPADLWKMSPRVDVDWTMEQLEVLDRLVEERQINFPRKRPLLTQQSTADIPGVQLGNGQLL